MLQLQVFSCVLNPVKYVHPNAFRGLLVLDRLRLRHTQLHQLQSLEHIGHSLKHLEVSFSANIQGNDAHNFNHLRNIRYLYMFHNGIIRTPFGLNLIANTLMMLSLGFNSITSLTSMEGVEFGKLFRLDLQHNNITHLRPGFLITPRLKWLNLEGNHLTAFADVTHYPWGSALTEHKHMKIILKINPWHCNGSLISMCSNLYRFGNEIIYAKPPCKPYIGDVQRLLCANPDARIGATVVPMDIIESVDISICSFHDLASKCYSWFTRKSNVMFNFTNLILFISS